VAGLVALGVTEGVDARAEDASRTADSSTSAMADAEGRPTIEATSAKRTTARKAGSKAVAGLVATLPGFEMLPDGGSRFFVALSHTANVVEKREARMLTYVIQGAHVALRNNENALVTVHFNTPVTRARLLPVRHDVVFAVELRADAVPVWRMVDASDGSSMLQIDFPKGAFLPAGEGESIEVADDPLPRPAGADDPPSADRQHRARVHRSSSRPPGAPSGD
jgi:hypothetical protein